MYFKGYLSFYLKGNEYIIDEFGTNSIRIISYEVNFMGGKKFTESLEINGDEDGSDSLYKNGYIEYLGPRIVGSSKDEDYRLQRNTLGAANAINSFFEDLAGIRAE